jgi:hypothetical protein
MNVNFKVSTSTEYFEQTGREIDWEENDLSKVSMFQSDAIQDILAIEASIYLMRRATGLCGSLSDSLIDMRSRLISDYVFEYEPYVEYNDFY